MIDNFMSGYATVLGYAVIIACCARVMVPILSNWLLEGLNAVQNLRNSE